VELPEHQQQELLPAPGRFAEAIALEPPALTHSGWADADRQFDAERDAPAQRVTAAVAVR